MKFKFLPNTATADIAFEAYGKTEEELFENAALATTEVMVDTKTVKDKISTKIKQENKNLENLLFDFLSEIIFLKDKDNLLFKTIKVKIQKIGEQYNLESTLQGENINPQVHKLRTDVKAITLHKFQIQKTPSGFLTQITLDI